MAAYDAAGRRCTGDISDITKAYRITILIIDHQVLQDVRVITFSPWQADTDIKILIGFDVVTDDVTIECDL